MKKPFYILTLVFLLLSPPAWADAAPQAQTIEIKNYHYVPATLTVPTGTKITWTNKDQVPHTIVEKNKKFRSGAMDTGDTYSYTFTTPGTYTYFCTLHTQMVGTIIVTGEAR